MLSLLRASAAKGFDLSPSQVLPYHLQKVSVNLRVRIQMLSVMEQSVTEANHATRSVCTSC